MLIDAQSKIQNRKSKILYCFGYQLRGSGKLLWGKLQFGFGKINVPFTVQRHKMDMGMRNFQSKNGNPTRLHDITFPIPNATLRAKFINPA